MKKSSIKPPIVNINKSRREIADKFLESIDDYLNNSGWKLDEYSLFRIDPITLTKHATMTAFLIQIERDLATS